LEHNIFADSFDQYNHQINQYSVSK